MAANTAPAGPDIDGTINDDLGNNLLGAALSGTTSGAGDVFSDTPLLAPLGDYGGPTQTMIPQAGSPALGAGNNTGGPSSDQRGSSRSTGSNTDIGAVEGALFTVINTNDSGVGSLRESILDANSSDGADNIIFSSLFNKIGRAHV